MGSSLYFGITLGIAFALGGKKTATYLPGRDKRSKKNDLFVQFDKPDMFLYEDTGVFDIRFGESKILRGCQPRIMYNGQVYTPTEKREARRLKLVRFVEGAPTTRTGLGKVSETVIEWMLPSDGSKRIVARVYKGEDAPFFQFKLQLPWELRRDGKGKFNEPQIEFPWFKNESNTTHVLTWANEKFAPPRMVFDFAAAPVILYDDELNALMFSTLDNFFITGIKKYKNGAISCGLAGSVKTVPVDFELESVLVFATGINKIVDDWGALFRRRHASTNPGGKARDPYSSPITAYLGYNTDNGAYYYYNTEKGMNYEETMIALRDHHQKIGLPVGYYELDSWWYPKSYEKLPGLLKIFLFGSALHWGEPPKPDVFPNGLKHLWERLGKVPLMCHSRWFSPESHYVKEYEFFIQEPSLKSFNLPLFAAPVNIDFWDDLFKASKEWGLNCYLQDWLSYQYDEIDPMKETVDFANTWTMNMGKAAAKHGITMQYCMAPSSFMMNAVKLPNMMQARASDDHNGMQPRRWYHPHFTQTSMLCHAIGFWPHKDTFFSSRKKAYWFFWERQPEMECLAAALSGGPVAPSDKIGDEDAGLLMRTCRSDGLLLKPDKPATPVDLMFKEHAKYYLTSTWSDKPVGLRWTYVHVTNLWPGRVKDKTVTLDDLGITSKRLAYRFFSKDAFVLQPHGDGVSLDLPKEGQELLVLCPELLEDVYLVGNPEKFVTCSAKQFPVIDVDDNGKSATITLEGVPGEVIPVLFKYEHEVPAVRGAEASVDQAKKQVHATLTLDGSGKGTLVVAT